MPKGQEQHQDHIHMLKVHLRLRDYIHTLKVFLTNLMALDRTLKVCLRYHQVLALMPRDLVLLHMAPCLMLRAVEHMLLVLYRMLKGVDLFRMALHHTH